MGLECGAYLLLRSRLPWMRGTVGLEHQRDDRDALEWAAPLRRKPDPTAERDFSQPQRCCRGEGLSLSRKEGRQAESEIAQATQNQPYPEKERDESRSVLRAARMDQPYAPEDCVRGRGTWLQVQKQTRRGVVAGPLSQNDRKSAFVAKEGPCSVTALTENKGVTSNSRDTLRMRDPVESLEQRYRGRA